MDSIVSHFYSSVGQIVLGIYRGATTVAIYALAIQLKSLFTSFSTALNSVLLPKVTALAAREGTENEISDLFIRVGQFEDIQCVYGRLFVDKGLFLSVS